MNPIDKQVGSRVRMRRLMLNMTQTALADALGLSLQQIQKYEKGSTRIGASRLQHLSQILQVPVEVFLGDQPPSHTVRNKAASPDPIMDFMTTAEGLALAKAFMSITNRPLRRRVADLVD